MPINYLENSLLLPQISRQEAERSIRMRRARIQSAEFSYGSDFFSFGGAYFDGGNEAAAYREYKYDSRFSVGVENITKFCSITTDSAILELGCAKGYVLAEFQANGYRDLIGVDISEYAISNGYKSVKDKLVCSSALSFLHNHSKRYDLIIIKEMLPHLAECDVDELLTLLPDRLVGHGYVYIEVQCAVDKAAADLIKKFDPTPPNFMG